MAAFSYEGNKVASHKVNQDGLRFKEGNAVVLPNSAWERHSAYLQFAYPALSSAPAADLILSRICRAYRSGSNTDGIVDLAIALESLLSAKVEIKFQFSMFNSLINTADVTERSHRFSLLQSLYDVRSMLVHGGKPGRAEKRKVAAVNAGWHDLLGIARANLTYYIEFCRTISPQSWSEHLRDLAFGLPRMQIGNEA